jgi:hypothetical protein
MPIQGISTILSARSFISSPIFSEIFPTTIRPLMSGDLLFFCAMISTASRA